LLASVYRLVALDVCASVFAVNVRWQRNVPVLFNSLVERCVRVELHDARTPIGHLLDRHVEAGRDVNDATGVELSARMHHRLVLTGVTGWAKEEHLRRRAGVACAEESRAKDPGRVQDECIARRNEVHEVHEVAVLERA
jgi:hypothetical protein